MQMNALQLYPACSSTRVPAGPQLRCKKPPPAVPEKQPAPADRGRLWFSFAFAAADLPKLPEVVPSPACLLGKLLKLWCGNGRAKPIPWGRCANCVCKELCSCRGQCLCKALTSPVLLPWAVPEAPRPCRPRPCPGWGQHGGGPCWRRCGSPPGAGARAWCGGRGWI